MITMTMSIPNPQLPDENLPSQNPSFVEDQQCEAQKTPHFDSQFSKALAFDDQGPEKLAVPDLNPDQFAQGHENPQDYLMEDLNDPDPDATPASSFRNVDIAAATSRRGPKRKKMGPKRTAQERKSREKLQVLVETLKPIPFIPAKALDFTSHESLLRRLGLWDFVHIEFDSSIRRDLLAQLVAGYTPTLRGSYVNGVKIMVNRADLGRALKLPGKKTAITEDVLETLDLAESIGFIEELVSNWILLHEDTYIMPHEVLACTKLIKEGHFEKVDWPGLIWSMVDKELKVPHLVNCYYASHLQHLIKTQHEELLGEERKVKIEVRDDEEEEEEEVEEDGSGDVKRGGVDDGRAHELEEYMLELSLGQDNVQKFEVENEPVGGQNFMDFEESKEEEFGNWLLDRKKKVDDPFLRHCNVGDVNSLDCGGQKKDEKREDRQDEEEEEEAEKYEHKGGFRLFPKCIPLVGMSSGNLIQTMEAEKLPFSSGIELRANSVGDFFSSREDAQRVSGLSLFGNSHKRDIGQDNHNLHHSLIGGSNKRLRIDSLWDAKPLNFDMCMDHIQHWMGKARMMYATKEQACEESSMNQQLFLSELQKRDSMIEHLHKAKQEESQKRQVEVYRLGRELYMMAKLLEDYRKALKETRKAFTGYRARSPQADEPLYKDVPGSRGLVLSVMELEKQRLKQEEEERMKLLVIEKELKHFEGGWIGKLEGHQNRIHSLGKRLLIIEDQALLLNEVNAKCKVLDTPECASSEEQTV